MTFLHQYTQLNDIQNVWILDYESLVLGPTTVAIGK